MSRFLWCVATLIHRWVCPLLFLARFCCKFVAAARFFKRRRVGVDTQGRHWGRVPSAPLIFCPPLRPTLNSLMACHAPVFWWANSTLPSVNYCCHNTLIKVAGFLASEPTHERYMAFYGLCCRGCRVDFRFLWQNRVVHLLLSRVLFGLGFVGQQSRLTELLSRFYIFFQ